jgi:uncharacterized protein (DUF2147 family)
LSTKEIWRVIPSIEGVLASSLGRLMVIPHHKPLPNGGERQYGGKPTYGQWDGSRYIYPFRGKTYKVARLVCEAFNGHPPFNEAVCMHADEDSRNNKADNLEWGTQKQNLNASGFISYCQSRTGDNNPRRKGMKKEPGHNLEA